MIVDHFIHQDPSREEDLTIRMCISRINSGEIARSKIVSILVARYLVATEPMPASEVENPLDYYRTMVKTNILKKLSYINESLFLNTKDIDDYCQKLFLARLFIMEMPLEMVISREDYVIETFFGFYRAIDDDTLEEIKKAGIKMNSLYQDIYRVSNYILNRIKD